ncbi:TPA: AMP-binding protein [Pseudomonas aeruginosa]|nr:AMP-binding protein [Pseudomonas fluorescens]HBO1995419.1 AMP-binding protein [Pseudomonas aeruginosa]
MHSNSFDRIPGVIAEQFNPDGLRTFPDVLKRAFELYPDNLAFTCLGASISFSELNRLSRNFAAYLQQVCGLKPGERIAIQLPNLLQYPVVAFAAIRAGLVIVNTNPMYTSRELKHQLNDSGARAMVLLDARIPMTDEFLAETSVEKLIYTRIADLPALTSDSVGDLEEQADRIDLLTALKLGSEQMLAPVKADPGTLALLQYTGGTTGVAKGAMLTHSNLVANQIQTAHHLRQRIIPGKEIYIAPLPLYHIYAFTVHLLALFGQGAHSVLIPNPSDIDSLIAAAKPWKFTGFAGINTLFVALCANEEFRQLDFSPLKLTSSGGMALTRDAAEQWHNVTGCQISEGYGLSETSPAVCLNKPEDPRIGTIGVTVVDTEIMVIDEEDNPLPQGEVGQLCVKGPQVMQGYWQRPVETSDVFLPGGWFKTGDMAVIQEDGLTRIVDRKKEMIIVSGFNVFPCEIEDVVCLHPGVRESAVIGIQDEKSGEKVRLYVVAADPGLTEKELLDYCRKNLTAYKVPKELVFCDQLPKSNVGKILRRVLKDEAMAARTAALLKG